MAGFVYRNFETYRHNKMTKLIVLDRDGVINEDSDDYIKSPEEYVPIKGSLEAISKLNRAGYTVVVATNQSGLARGYFSEDTLQQMHNKLENLLTKAGGKIEKIFVCPHSPDDHCDCRKPRPGLLLKILEEYPADPKDIVFVGDSLKDLQAAHSVGLTPILVRTGKGVRTESSLKKDENSQFADVAIFENLAQAADHLLGK